MRSALSSPLPPNDSLPLQQEVTALNFRHLLHILMNTLSAGKWCCCLCFGVLAKRRWVSTACECLYVSVSNRAFPLTSLGILGSFQVYRLITCGTVEEKIYRKQVFKGGLSRSSTKEGSQFRYFSQQASIRILLTSKHLGYPDTNIASGMALSVHPWPYQSQFSHDQMYLF